MELMNQPFTGQLGNRLIEFLDSQEYHTLNIVVAFAKNSGVLRIKDALQRFRKRGGIINTYLGIDLAGTSYEALTSLLLHTNSLNVVHSEKGQTFHPKIYQFLGRDKGLIIVGSHNLTGGGLWTNFESSVIVPLEKSNASLMQKLSGLNNYIEDLSSIKDSFMPINAQEDIDKLLQNGYVFKEIYEKIFYRNTVKQKKDKERLFGNGVSAKLPLIPAPQKGNTEVTSKLPLPFRSISINGEDPTIWFETRKMTGGSRNILDLSKKSLISRGNPKGTSFDLGDPKFIRGGVEFFGLNPAATSQSKNITLNFEGVDYINNTILFPDGDKANGTWRLQIKGINSSGQRITDAFKAKNREKYLVEKIITFTKIEDDYYFLSVFPETELENFKSASWILARNGITQNAKLLGLI